jgi:hypothetical protein
MVRFTLFISTLPAAVVASAAKQSPSLSYGPMEIATVAARPRDDGHWVMHPSSTPNRPCCDKADGKGFGQRSWTAIIHRLQSLGFLDKKTGSSTWTALIAALHCRYATKKACDGIFE